MLTALVILAVWSAAGVPLALLVGLGIRHADRRTAVVPDHPPADLAAASR